LPSSARRLLQIKLSAPRRQQLGRFALESVGKGLEPLDCDPSTAMLIGLDGAGGYPDRLGEARLREAAARAELGQAGTDTAVDMPFSWHGATPYPQNIFRTVAGG
jgi:hypothetical protein